MATSATQMWHNLLWHVLNEGQPVAPRGKRTLELSQHTITMDMRRPVLMTKDRKLSYQGMAAEALWIVHGSDLLGDIEPWLPRMREFSDDGVRLFGAYGPRIKQQLEYVVNKLAADPDTRQATLTLWKRCPTETKDYPCTIAMDFKLRSGKLNMHVFMRSSDVWLGIPYDVFSFSMVTHLVCCRLNAHLERAGVTPSKPIEPGTLFLTAASSHLYETNWLEALALRNISDGDTAQYPTPAHLFTDEDRLKTRLAMLRHTGPGDKLRWWESGQ